MASTGNPYHKGKGKEGGEFTSKGEAGFDSPQEAEKWADGHLPFPSYSDAEKQALGDYQGDDDSFATINTELRAGALPSKAKPTNSALAYQQDMVGNLDSAIAKARLTAPLTVFRGFARGEGLQVEVGATITDKGYWSTSMSREVANWFSSAGGDVFQIRLRAGDRAAYLDDLSGRALGEAEVLLPRGSSFKVLSAAKGRFAPGMVYTLEPAG